MKIERCSFYNIAGTKTKFGTDKKTDNNNDHFNNAGNNTFFAGNNEE